MTRIAIINRADMNAEQARVYDMAKAVDRSMVIGEISLAEKVGGRSGHWQRK